MYERLDSLFFWLAAMVPHPHETRLVTRRIDRIDWIPVVSGAPKVAELRKFASQPNAVCRMRDSTAGTP